MAKGNPGPADVRAALETLKSASEGTMEMTFAAKGHEGLDNVATDVVNKIGKVLGGNATDAEHF